MSQHKRTRRLKQSCMLTAALISFPLLLWTFSLQPTPQTESSVAAFTTIISEPLPASMIVETQAGTAPTVFSSSDTVAMIETDPAQQLVNELDDQGLLALVGDRPVILVRHGPQDAELLFVNSADQAGWRREWPNKPRPDLRQVLRNIVL
jgi:hypothetical protein